MNIQPSSIKNKGYTNKQNKELGDLSWNKHRQKLQKKNRTSAYLRFVLHDAAKGSLGR